MTLGCENLGQGQEGQKDAAEPRVGLPTYLPQ